MTHNNCQSLRAPGANGPEHHEPDVSLMIVNTWWQHGSNMQHACWPHMLRANKQKLGLAPNGLTFLMQKKWVLLYSKTMAFPMKRNVSIMHAIPQGPVQCPRTLTISSTQLQTACHSTWGPNLKANQSGPNPSPLDRNLKSGLRRANRTCQ